MEIHLHILGIINIILAAIHLAFPTYFNWREDLRPLSLINRQMMQVHTFFIGLTVFGIGLLSLFCATELIQTPLGNKLCFGLIVFWGLRLIFQFFVYSGQLWKGKRFETGMHIVFSGLWLYSAAVYFLCWWH